MAVRADSFPFPAALVRRFLAPTITWGLFTTLVVTLRRRLSEPRLPRMSDEWLQHLERESSHTIE